MVTVSQYLTKLRVVSRDRTLVVMDVTSLPHQGRVLPLTCAYYAGSGDTGRGRVPWPTEPLAQQGLLPLPHSEQSSHKLSIENVFHSSLEQDSFDKSFAKKPLSVKGRLAKHFDFWQNINANQFVLDTIKYGYVLPFVSTPPGVDLKNNKSALKHEQFVTQAINDLLATGAVQELNYKPYVINLITVAENCV